MVFHLVSLSGQGGPQSILLVEGRTVSLGSWPAADFYVEGGQGSRTHSQVLVSEGRVLIRSFSFHHVDPNPNVSINERPLGLREEIELHAGDLIRVGAVLLRLEQLPPVCEEDWKTSAKVEWLLSTPAGMLSPRKVRLFTCSCCRQIWNSQDNPKIYQFIEQAERLADAENEPWDLSFTQWAFGVPLAYRLFVVMDNAPPKGALMVTGAIWRESAPAERGPRQRHQADLLRDLVGNPFRPVPLDPAWVAWNDGVVARLARSIYDERRFEELPVLADALEDAGCTEASILDHCRSGKEHARGCWALDLVLGRS